MSNDVINEVVIEEPYGFIYITTNMCNGKRYLGQRRFDNREKWKYYIGSGAAFKQAINKYGRENFIRNIIDIAYSEEELNKKEYEYSVFLNVVESHDWYNLVYGGGAISGYHISEETKKKMSDSKKRKANGEKSQDKLIDTNNVNNDIYKTNDENNQLNKRHLSEETRLKISMSNKGKVIPEYRRKKMSESHKGAKNPNYGKVFSKETREKMSAAAKKRLKNPENHPMFDKHLSEETKQKIQENRTKPTGIHHFASKQVLCIETGLLYESISDASKNTGIRHGYISEVCNGIRENAKGYHFKYISKQEYDEIINERN